VVALYFAARDPRVPWYAKAVAAAVAAYALSPIDPVPDFIPVLGYLDEFVVLPLGILLAVKLIPPEIMAEHRATAGKATAKPKSRIASGPLPSQGDGLGGYGARLKGAVGPDREKHERRAVGVGDGEVPLVLVLNLQGLDPGARWQRAEERSETVLAAVHRRASLKRTNRAAPSRAPPRPSQSSTRGSDVLTAPTW
jgi:uncharacterized membrane protein YkvA (DUF1232 family)